MGTTLALAADRGVLRGTVIEEEWQLPVPDIEMTIRCADAAPRSAITDDNGRYLVNALPGDAICTLETRPDEDNDLGVVRVEGLRTFDIGGHKADLVLPHGVSELREVDGLAVGRPRVLATPEDYHPSTTRTSESRRADGWRSAPRGPALEITPTADTADLARLVRWAADTREGPRPIEDGARQLLARVDSAGPDAGPVGLELEVAAHPLDPARALLLLELHTAARPAAVRPPARLTMLVDGSRGDTFGRHILDAMSALIDRLGPADQVAIVHFGGGLGVDAPPTWSNRADDLEQTISRFQFRSGGGLEQGLDLAAEQARAMYLEGGTNQILVFSDGITEGGPSAPSFLSDVSSLAADGIRVTAVEQRGTPAEHFSLMEAIARAGDGAHHLVDKGEDFRATVHPPTLMETVLADAGIALELSPRAVRGWRVLGRAHPAEGGGEAPRATLGGGQQEIVLLELLLDPRPGPRLAKATLSGTLPEDGPKTWTAEVRTKEVHPRLSEASPDLQRAWALSRLIDRLLGRPGAPRWDELEATLTPLLDPARRNHDLALRCLQVGAERDPDP